MCQLGSAYFLGCSETILLSKYFDYLTDKYENSATVMILYLRKKGKKSNKSCNEIQNYKGKFPTPLLQQKRKRRIKSSDK